MFENKNILVLGLARSGMAAAKALYLLNAKVTITDMKTESQLTELAREVQPYVQDMVLGGHPELMGQFDYVVISPGIPLDIPYVEKIKEMRVPIIGELELAFLLTQARFLGITGTNGKTTTTALLGEIFKSSGKASFVVGNIGLPAVSKSVEATEHTTLITEVSSFQLETINQWKCHVGAILNITPDHLNRHKTMDQYIAAKLRIFENQTTEDWAVLNYDDPITRNLSEGIRSKKVYFSRVDVLDEGAYVENGMIKIKLNGSSESICSANEVFMPGDHNLSNVLAASLMAFISGISKEDIAKVLKTFKGVEHRIEYVDAIEGRVFYNDSKATNPDSTICAIEAMKTPTHLIAGGMDKGSDFSEMIDSFGDRIVSLILFGETKYVLEKTAKSKGFDRIVVVDDLSQAVKAAYKQSQPGETILLSPACASWDMYRDFEERGDHFKRLVKQLKETW